MTHRTAPTPNGAASLLSQEIPVPHPLVYALADRAATLGDLTLQTWAHDVLPALIDHASSVPAKGFTRRDASLLPNVSHLPASQLEAMAAQSMAAHVLAATLPVADLARILGLPEPTRRLALTTLTLHDAGKAEAELGLTLQRQNPTDIQHHHQALESLALRWGLASSFDQLQGELGCSRLELLALLSWTTSNTEQVRGHNSAPEDHGVDARLWRTHEHAVRLATTLSYLGDLIASLGVEGFDARQIARERRLKRTLQDIADMTGTAVWQPQSWTLRRERTMTTALLQEAVQLAIRESGGHPWLISRGGGVALLPASVQLPGRQEIDVQFRRVLGQYIVSKSSLNPGLVLAGNLPHEKKASTFLLGTKSPGEIPAALLESARRSFSLKKGKETDYALNVTVAAASACLSLLRSHENMTTKDTPKWSNDQRLGAVFAQADTDLFPDAKRWATDLQIPAKGNFEQLKAHVARWLRRDAAPLEGGSRPGTSDTPEASTGAGAAEVPEPLEMTEIARAITHTTARLLKDCEPDRERDLIQQALREVLAEDLSLPGESAGTLSALQERTATQVPCWRCGEARSTIDKDALTGTMLMSGYNVRQRPAFGGIKAAACRSCVLEELLLKAEDPQRKESRQDIYVHVLFDGFVSPLQTDGAHHLAEQLRRTQPWRLAAEPPTWALPHAPASSLWEEPAQAVETPSDDHDFDLLAQDESTGHEAEDDAGAEGDAASVSLETDKTLFFRRILSAPSGTVPTHFAVRFNTDGKTSTADMDAIALGASLSLHLLGMRVVIDHDPQPPTGTPDAHILDVRVSSPVWTLWAQGERRFGLQELPLLLRSVRALHDLTYLRFDTIDSNKLRSTAQELGRTPLRGLSVRVVAKKDSARVSPSKVERALPALEDHLTFLTHVNRTQGDPMTYLRTVNEKLAVLRWPGRNAGSTHGRTKPLKDALSTLAAHARTGQTWAERQDARDLTFGRVQRALESWADPAVTVDFVEAIDTELLQGLCGGSVEKLRQMEQEIVQASAPDTLIGMAS